MPLDPIPGRTAVAIDLDESEIDTNSPHVAALLDNLQCNILKSHGRDFARLLFLRFTAPPDEVKAWIRRFAETRVTSARKQFAESAVYKADRTPGGVVGAFLLSAAGYEYLGFDPDELCSRAFRNGMKHRGLDIPGAVLDRGNKDPDPGTWEDGYRGDLHALVALADDSEDVLAAEAAAVRAEAGAVATITAVEEGVTLRRNKEPVEHFGYLDGRSNPVFTKSDVDDEKRREGEPAGWDPSAPLRLVLAKDRFTDAEDAYGSFLVFRKLGQDVRAFDDRVADLATALGVSPELAGAMVVGRFKDGTPVATADTPGSGGANNFNYDGDGGASRCPFHAHIRKANPRGTAPLTTLKAERGRRIVRRGVPYGRPLPGTADTPAAGDAAPATPRGLLFMCFQHDIADQFEFIQRAWVDNPHFPTRLRFPFLRDTGDDPLIGQDNDEAQRWPTAWGDENGRQKEFNFESLVTLKGGEYFFCPSLPFLKSL